MTEDFLSPNSSVTNTSGTVTTAHTVKNMSVMDEDIVNNSTLVIKKGHDFCLCASTIKKLHENKCVC